MRRSDPKRSLGKDDRAVSSVVGVLMLIAYTVIIAAVVMTFAYDFIGSVAEVPQAPYFVTEDDIRAGDTDITIIHHGGAELACAFKANNTKIDGWDNVTITLNGKELEVDNVMLRGDGDNNFGAGEEMQISVPALSSGDVIAIVYTPTGSALRRLHVR